MSVCTACSLQFTAGTYVVPCICCNKLYHGTTECAQLSATEIRVIQLKNQVMVFKCKTCQDNGNTSLRELQVDIEQIKTACDQITPMAVNINNIEKDIKELKAETAQIPQIQNKLKTLESNVNILSNKNQNSRFIDERVIHEVQSRLEKSKNIIIYNIDDSINNTDLPNKVQDILKNIPINTLDIKTTRIGKSDNNNSSGNSSTKPRPVVVTLKSHQDVMLVLRNKDNLDKIYKVNSDKTKLQQLQLHQAYAELTSRTEAGETDLIVKFINNVPSVIKKPGTLDSTVINLSSNSKNTSTNVK